MKKILLPIGVVSCCLVFSAVHSQVKAQTRTVTGQINNGESPIKGATITQEGTSQMTTTSSSGTFTLQITGENPVLVIRHPEYTEQKISTDGKTSYRISLTEKVNSIEEVVLNAGYYEVKAKESTGSIARVTAKEIENQPVNNVLSAIQGRMAGVSIIQNSGVAGGGFDVQIRGRNSLRTYETSGYDANSPLYIIDGVPVPSLNEYKSGLSNAVIPYGDTNPLSNISIDDIETIDVLKDADATSIYGSKGANGVVLITTKKGIKGKTLIKLSNSWGIGQIANLPTMMSKEEYIKIRKIAFANDGILTYPSNQYDINGTWDEKRETDWQKYFVGNTAELSNVQLGISGGSNTTSFSISAGHNEETSVFPGSYRYKKNNAAVNLQHTSSDRKLKVTFSSYFTIQDNQLPPTDFNLIYASLAPNAPALYTSEGKLNWENNTFFNPLAAASQTYNTTNTNLTTNTNINYIFGKGISFNLNAGYINNDTSEKRILPKTFFNPSSNIGSERSELRKVSMLNTNWILEPQLNYDKNWGNHQLSVLLGASFQDQKSDNQTLYGTNFPSDDLLNDLSAAQIVRVENTYNFVYRYQALYSRLNYALNQKYFVNLTGRRDGSSRFGSGRRFANFGAVGMAWLFSEEEFLKNSKWLSFGKIRASYGIAGNDQISDYQFYDTYYSTGSSYDGYQGLLPSRLYNENFGWESTKKTEAAIELAFFKERLSMSGAWYRNISDNQLVGIPLPATTGFTSIQANLNASVMNSGLEFVLQYKVTDKENLKWATSFNITFPKTSLLSFPNLEGSSYKNFYEVGKSTALRKLYHYTGIDPVSGLYTFEDTNGDGILNSNDKTVVKELTQHWYGGLQNNVKFKNWSLNILFQLTHQNLLNMYSNAGRLGSMGNKAAVYLDYWSLENPDAQFQMPSAGYNSDAAAASTMFTQSDATITNTFTLRLKNISLSYALPTNTHNRLNTKLFIQGQNVLTFSNYKGVNPEFNLPGFTSPLRIISTGINLTY